MRNSAIALGLVIMFQAYTPLIVWYSGRRTDIQALKATNESYYKAWNFLWISHFLVYQLPALLFPFTFLHSQTVNDFYMLINYWVATWLGFSTTMTNTLLFLIALIKFEDEPDLSVGVIVMELLGYLVLTAGVWFGSMLWLVPDAYIYLQLQRPEELRTKTGHEINPEETEDDAPTSAFNVAL